MQLSYCGCLNKALWCSILPQGKRNLLYALDGQEQESNLSVFEVSVPSETEI